MHLFVILFPDTPQHRRSGLNPLDPLLQLREFVHLLLGNRTLLPSPHPGVRIDIGNTVRASTRAHQVLPGFTTGQATGQVQFQYVVDSKSFGLESLNGIYV